MSLCAELYKAQSGIGRCVNLYGCDDNLDAEVCEVLAVLLDFVTLES